MKKAQHCGLLSAEPPPPPFVLMHYFCRAPPPLAGRYESLLIRILLSLLSLLLLDDDPESHEFMSCRVWRFDTPADMSSLSVQHCRTCSVSNYAFTKPLACLQIEEVGTCGNSLTSSFPTFPNLGSTFIRSPHFRLRFAFTLARVRAWLCLWRCQPILTRLVGTHILTRHQNWTGQKFLR